MVTGHQYLVDILQETLIFYFRISEKETHWLVFESCNFVKGLYIFEKISYIIGLGYGYLERISTLNICSQSGK